MKSKFHKQYCRALVIVHGASELQLAQYVKTKLRLPLEIYSRDNGRTSIQINGLMNILENSSILKNANNFINNYYTIERYNGIPKNFRVFPIMDTDDCKSEEIRGRYIDGSLFKNHWLNQYIVPIFNTESLEDVMIKCKLIDKNLSDREKISTYQKLFPVSKGSPEDVKSLCERFRACESTNLNDFFDYCLNWADECRIK